MSKGLLIGLGVAAIAIIYVVCINFWTMGVEGEEIARGNSVVAQVNVVETSMDTMINTIVNEFKVPQQFAKDFIAAAVVQSGGRKGGLLFKSNAEAANKFGIPETLYLKMMNTIEG